ncbi:MAG: class I SAM-dependent DNA methyltransferase [Planctomycetaceae bacterium]
MPISWNEIRHNAVAFSKDWADVSREDSEAEILSVEFFDDHVSINIQAVELLGELHDALEAGGYSGHDLERFLVRVLFCLFAEDTGLIDRSAFTLFIENHTESDGSDLGAHLARLFQVLNTPSDKRQKNLLEELSNLPYVNGDLFTEALSFADFNREMRDRLLACCRFDWSRISPAVFGSLFQSVMEPRERRQAGAHYTSERDILKLVRSLFLDDLRAEFASLAGNKKKLAEFHKKLGQLTFFDPACGCGNFLVVTYRELRLLEIEVLKKLHGRQKVIDIHDLSVVDVDAMYGIEINEFPVRIAEVALWLVDHQMNQRLSEAFGQYFVRLPLKKSATIRCANALQIDWNDVLPVDLCSYVLGNPPFVGGKYQTDEQRADMAHVTGELKNYGLLDYVTGWYFKAAEYIKDSAISVAFVSTNSITQGEQVGVLWGQLLRLGIHIRFGHRTFAWESEARGKAHVHVVIVGFGYEATDKKRIYDYETNPAQPQVSAAQHISPYLVEGVDTVVTNRSVPLCKVPEIKFGNQPIDGGYLLLDEEQKNDFLQECPRAKKWIRLFLGSREFINGEERWCLWLKDALPNELRECGPVMQRIDQVKQFRLSSKRPETVKLAGSPSEFAFVSHVENEYLIVPSASSERRRYIPMAFMPANVIASNLCLIIPGATRFHFGILTSTMHMAWVRQVCGRLKSDYRYSASLVYNNFPWPERPTDKQKAVVEVKAQAVLDARAEFPDSSLAQLYDPRIMPAPLRKAHADLDQTVELCYRSKPFESDRERVEFLFALYEKITAPLTAGLDKPIRRRKSK